MRHVTIVLTPSDDVVQSSGYQEEHGGDGDPSEIWLDGTYIATQEAIQYLNLLDDGTIVGITRLRGDPDRIAELEDELPEFMSCTATRGDTTLAYMRYEAEEYEKQFFELIDTEGITVDWPMLETADGLQVTLFGEETALKNIVAGVPDGMDVTLKRVGEYQPEMDDPAGQLTDRQKEILRTAITLGYYDIPRSTSQRDLATELGLSRGTIGEHLRRAEAKIIQSVVV